LCGCCPSEGAAAPGGVEATIGPPSGRWVKSPRASSRTIRRHASLRSATRWGHAAHRAAGPDGGASDRRLYRNAGASCAGRDGDNTPCTGRPRRVSRRNLWRTVYWLDHPSPQRAGGPSCRAATDSTRHRLSSGAIRLGQRCIAGSIRESFSSPSLWAGMAFAFGERRRSDGRASGWIS
jgi:hypothetical protein